MAFAFMYPEPERSDVAKKVWNTLPFSKQRLSDARVVLRQSPDLADRVIKGILSLDDALIETQQRQPTERCIRLPPAQRRRTCVCERRAVQIRETAKRTAEGIVKIGQWLTEVKERLEQGQWPPWLKAGFGWSRQTAVSFMQVYELAKLSKLWTFGNGCFMPLPHGRTFDTGASPARSRRAGKAR